MRLSSIREITRFEFCWVFRLSCEPEIRDCTAEVLRTGRNVHENKELLPPRRQERQVRKFNFFAAFAPLREIFRFFVVLSLSGENFFTRNPEEPNLLALMRRSDSGRRLSHE